MRHPFPLLPLFFFLLLSSLHISHSAFTEADVRGTYRLKLGAPSCSDFITIREASVKIPAQSVRMWKNDCPQQDADRRRRCAGGRINLLEDVEVGTAAQLFFGQRMEQVGTYLSGPSSSRVRCACRTFLEQNKVIVFVKPEVDMPNVTWDQVFVGESDIGANSSTGVFNFRQGVRYVLVGARCFYRQAEGRGQGPACFSADSTVLMEGGHFKRMREVETGERVATPGGGGTEVIGWTHKEERGAWYWAAHLDGGATAKATAGHLVQVKAKGGEQLQVVRMGQVTPNMWMRADTGDWRRVEKVGWVRAWGLYNLQTTTGEVIVDGTVFTTYTEEVGVGVGHSLLAPMRAVAYTLGGAGMAVEVVIDTFAQVWRWLLPLGISGNHRQMTVPLTP